MNFAFEVGHRFGPLQKLECHALKSKLVYLEQFGTGRVLLSTFSSRARSLQDFVLIAREI